MDEVKIELSEKENNTCYIHVYGMIKADHVKNAYNQYLELNKTKSFKHIIWDFSDALMMVYDQKEIFGLAQHVIANKDQTTHTKTALIIKEALNQDAATTYETITENSRANDLKIFYMLEEAQEWISEP
jgi:hypothetical protein